MRLQILASILAVTFSTTAMAAQEPEPLPAPPPASSAGTAGTSPSPAQEQAQAIAEQKPEPEPKAKEDQAQNPAFLGLIERMPPSAFPEPRVRGIQGGSLRTTFHGLQWPYYPKTGIGISGSVWVDTGYEHIKRGNPTEQSIKYWLQQGRFLLRVTPTYTNGKYFIQGQAELVANKDQSLHQPDVADADDVWIKAGMWNVFDVQVGRYEAWEVYHFGMGLDLYTLERQGAYDEALAAPDIYGLTYAFYRPAGVGQLAVHLYPTDYLRFELGTQFGNEFGSNTLAGRPVAVLDLGVIKVKGGVEYKKLTDQKEGAKGEKTLRGSGASIQAVFDPYIEFGVNGAYGLTDHIATDGTVDEKGSVTTYSVGGFANVRIIPDLVAGVGLNYTYLEDLHFDPALNRVENFTHIQTFGALQYLLFKQLYIKAVVAYAKADFNPTFGDPIFKNEMFSTRLRLQYLF
jgi:hypothetical protein